MKDDEEQRPEEAVSDAVKANRQDHRRASTNTASRRPTVARHIGSGPGFVTKETTSPKVEKYAGQYR